MINDLFDTNKSKFGSNLMSKDIKIDKFDISIPSNVLFKDANLILAHGRKYGLIGANGSGKSTLLKSIVSRENEFKMIPKHFDILFVEQEVEASQSKSALELVLSADETRTELLKEEKKIQESLETANDENSQNLIEKLYTIYEKLSECESWSAESRASSILTGLQFTEEMKTKPSIFLSGGWRMRVAIARALFRKPTLLLLDEPTNHLDLFAVLWLENYLSQHFKNTFVVVSHDQEFLNNTTTDIIHVWEQKLHYYKGSYDHFKYVFEKKMEDRWMIYEKNQKLLKEAQKTKKKMNREEKKNKNVEKVKEKIQSTLRNQNKNDNLKTGKQEQDEKTEILLERPKEYKVKFRFNDPETISVPVIQFQNVVFKYSEKDPEIFRNLNFGINMNSRIALVGPNGAGKSTLLKLMCGKLEPSEGEVLIHRKLEMGMFSQHFVDQLVYDETPVEYLQRLFPKNQEFEIRSQLGSFGLNGSMHKRSIQTLSGGQKSRVLFAELSMKMPHVLFLDEPTNHLDIESVDALVEALNNFKGGIILVSHDIRLIKKVCNEIWVVQNNTAITYDGDFDEYRDELIVEFEKKEKEEEKQRQIKEEKELQLAKEKLKMIQLKKKQVLN